MIIGKGGEGFLPLNAKNERFNYKDLTQFVVDTCEKSSKQINVNKRINWVFLTILDVCHSGSACDDAEVWAEEQEVQNSWTKDKNKSVPGSLELVMKALYKSDVNKDKNILDAIGKFIQIKYFNTKATLMFDVRASTKEEEEASDAGDGLGGLFTSKLLGKGDFSPLNAPDGLILTQTRNGEKFKQHSQNLLLLIN